jgi:hypothetical protein
MNAAEKWLGKPNQVLTIEFLEGLLGTQSA